MTYRVVAIGASLGGLAALKTVLRGLRPEFPLPIAIVLHQGSGTTGGLATLLQQYSALPVHEPHDKERMVPSTVYVAPAGYHLLVERDTLALTTDGPVLHARPSIDVLFESAASSFGSGTIGVALTASSEDGVQGLCAIKRRGGLVVVQDPATAESRVLPDAALAALTPDAVLPLPKIGPFLALTTSLAKDEKRSVRLQGVN